ncbi:MAG: hypothetical protein ACRD30_03445, partial [Bryobacteraceae bacterium]
MRFLPFAFVFAAALSAASIRAPRERSFSFEYSVKVKNLPASAHTLDLWIPVPHDDPYQRIANLKFDSPVHYNIATGADGNVILHLRTPRPASGSLALTMR